MEDKQAMENILLTAKGVCDLYMHGALEASDSRVHQAFDRALSESLSMQDEIYQKMTAKGWYPTEQVEQQKIDKVKQKFSSSMQ